MDWMDAHTWLEAFPIARQKDISDSCMMEGKKQRLKNRHIVCAICELPKIHCPIIYS